MDNNSALQLNKKLLEFKEKITDVIEQGRQAKLKSENIADYIFKRVIIDEDIVIEEGVRAERPLSMEDIVIIARKAVEQAHFDGVFVVLPSGEKIKRKTACDFNQEKIK